MDAFFSQYESSGFTRNAESGLIKSFNALAISQGWDSDDRDDAYDNFRAAMVAEFNRRYGTNEKDLKSWQNLCKVFNIRPVPPSITKCKEEIKRTHVNLVDLIELPENNPDGIPAKVFPDLPALRKYTKRTKKYFPREDAKAGGILKNLLREIHGRRRR